MNAANSRRQPKKMVLAVLISLLLCSLLALPISTSKCIAHADSAQTIALTPQTIPVFSTKEYPLELESTYPVYPTSSNNSVARATYRNGFIRIEAHNAGNAQLRISSKVSPTYTIDVTVVTIPVADTSINTNGTNLRFKTTLGGANINMVSHPSIESKLLTSGESYDKLRNVAKHELLGTYSVELKATGDTIHSDFGTMDISFPVPANYKETSVVIHHLHSSTSPSNKQSVHYHFFCKPTCGGDWEIDLNVSYDSEGYVDAYEAYLANRTGRDEAKIQTMLQDGLPDQIMNVIERVYDISLRFCVTVEPHTITREGMESSIVDSALRGEVEKNDASTTKYLNGDSISSEYADVLDGMVTITVSDLSTFALESTTDQSISNDLPSSNEVPDDNPNQPNIDNPSNTGNDPSDNAIIPPAVDTGVPDSDSNSKNPSPIGAAGNEIMSTPNITNTSSDNQNTADLANIGSSKNGSSIQAGQTTSNDAGSKLIKTGDRASTLIALLTAALLFSGVVLFASITLRRRH